MTNENKKENPDFNYKKCMACTMCVEVCPVSCLALSINPLGIKRHRYPYLRNQASCISCGQCALECPADAINMIGLKAAA